MNTMDHTECNLYRKFHRNNMSSPCYGVSLLRGRYRCLHGNKTRQKLNKLCISHGILHRRQGILDDIELP